MLEFVPQTGSTNADLAARLRGGEAVAEGDWLIADRQTAGRGRQGREWFDGAGNFMGSTVVRSRAGDPPLHTLALVAGLAAQTALPAAAGARLKWPNDLMIGRAKLAGILLEREGDAVLIGIGVNLSAAPQLADRKTISLAQMGLMVERDAFAAELARVFDLELARWRSFGLAPIVSRWLEAAHPIGTPLHVGEPGEVPVEGSFAGLADSGALRLRLANGDIDVIHAGEVRFAEPPR